MKKFNLPGITISLFVYQFFPHHFVAGLFIICFLVAWRAQLAARAKVMGVETLTVSTLDTSRVIAGECMNHPIPAIVPATQAVMSTITWEPVISDPSASVVQKSSAVHRTSVELTYSKGQKKLLSPTQITGENLQMHRRGVIASITGKLQNDPIFSTNQVLANVDVYNLNFSEFFKLFKDLLTKFNIPLGTLNVVFAQGNYDHSVGTITKIGDKIDPSRYPDLSPVPEDKLEDAAFAYIGNFISNLGRARPDGILRLNDGILLSVDNNNILPLEIDLPIQRTLPPSKINAAIDPALAAKDPYLKLAADQIADYNASIKELPTASRKRAVFTPSTGKQNPAVSPPPSRTRGSGKKGKGKKR